MSRSVDDVRDGARWVQDQPLQLPSGHCGDVFPSEKPLRELAEEAAAADDPMRALGRLVELRTELETVIHGQISRALGAGYSFTDLARVLGISRQAAHRRYRALAVPAASASEERPTATEEATHVLRLARDEAVRRDAVALGSEHVLIGVLRGTGEGARLLHQHGVGLAAARAFVGSVAWRSNRAPDVGGLGSGVRRVLLEAMRVAAAKGESQVGVSTLLLAALADPDDGARRVVDGLGANVASLRRQLRGGGRNAATAPARL